MTNIIVLHVPAEGGGQASISLLEKAIKSNKANLSIDSLQWNHFNDLLVYVLLSDFVG